MYICYISTVMNNVNACLYLASIHRQIMSFKFQRPASRRKTFARVGNNIVYCRMGKNKERRRLVDTRNDAKCSEVITALKPTTGTNAARSVPSITCKIIHGSGKLQFQTNTLERTVCQPEEAYALTRGAYAM